jgi:hypothetical protein
MVITRNLTRLDLSQTHPCPLALRHFDWIAITASELKYAATLKFSQRSRRLLLYVPA